MTDSIRTLRWIGLCAVAASCAGATGSSDAGHGTSSGADAGLDGGWTTHPILNTGLCGCPGQTAGHFTSASSGPTTVEWLRSFTPTTLSSGDQLVLSLDFAGPATWQIGLLDGAGKVAFPTTGGPALDSVNWNCIQVNYEIGPDQYSVSVDGAPKSGEMNTFSSTSSVAGIEVQYIGTGTSAAWIDSVVVTYIAKSGATQTLLSESFDNPASASDGLRAGDGTVATPPASIMIPNLCIAFE